MTPREALIEEMKNQTEIWEAQITEAKARVAAAQREGDAAYEDKLDQMRRNLADAREKLEQLEDGDAADWEDLVPSVREAWLHLNRAFMSARGRFI